MKRLFILLPFFLNILISSAQNEPLFIFNQYYNAKIHFKNHSISMAAMNYDAVNDKMYFKQNNELMELINTASIDSIVWAKKRCFIPLGNGYLEKVNVKNGTIYIHWRIKNVNVGSRGALGSITQGKVENINIRTMGVFSSTDPSSHNADVYQQKNANEYYLSINGKPHKVNTLKQIQKLFPQHKETIKTFVDDNNIKMNEPLSVMELLNYCMGL